VAEFQPSAASLSSRKRALLTLQYAKQAITVLERHIESHKDEAVPDWVVTRIGQAAACLGQAVSFASFQQSRRKR